MTTLALTLISIAFCAFCLSQIERAVDHLLHGDT